MDLLRVSPLQFDVIWENPASNRLKIADLLSPLMGKTDLVLLPEMFSTGFSYNVGALAETMEGETVQWMKRQAILTDAALAGSLMIQEEDHFYNRFLFVMPSGEIFHYDKRHLFTIGGENQYFSHGNKRVIVEYRGWRIALFTCYDLRFPVWCRSIKVADLMLFAASWPGVRKHVWQTLLKARAIENQLYVAGVNRTGMDGSGISYYGGSMVIDPKGFNRCNLAGKPQIVETCILSLSELNRFRKKFPVSDDEDTFDISV